MFGPWLTLVSSLAALSLYVSVTFAEDAARVDAEMCGANSLALAASYLSANEPRRVRSVLDSEKAPFSLHDLHVAAQKTGLRSAVLHWSDKGRARFDCPAILHVRADVNSTTCDHFITCFGQHGDSLCVADYPRSPTLVSRDWVLRFWDGDALYLDSPRGTRIDAIETSGRFEVPIWGLVAVAGAVLLLMAGPLVARWQRRFCASRTRTWITAVVVLAVAIAAGLAWRARTSDDGPALQALARTLTVRGDPHKRGGREKVVFQLKNSSRRAITVDEVSTTCSCLVPAGVLGKTLRPGEQWPLEVQVGVPELGTMTQQLFVAFDGPGSPLVLGVKAEGRMQLPVLETVENRFPLFDDLADVTAVQTIVVKTAEETGSKPWLDELSTAHPSIKIRLKGVSEEIEGGAGFLRRTYRYSVGWNSIPEEREVRSLIYAETAIDPKPGIFIGSVAALVKRSGFSPTVVHLQHGKAEKELVVFQGPQDPSQPWKVSEMTRLPAWLAAHWQESEGTVTLRLSLTDAFDGMQPERFQISLVKGDGEGESLTVVAYPAP